MEPRRHERARVLASAHADQERPREVEREPEAERRHDVLSIQRWTSAGGDTSPSVRVNAASTRRVASSASSADRAWTSPIDCAGLEPVADLAADHESHGGVDRVAFPDPARAERDARRADRLSIHAAERTGPVGLDRHDDGRRGQDRARVVHHARIAALRLDHATEALERLSAVQRVLGACHRLVVGGSLGGLQSFRREQDREVAQPPAERPAQELDRLDDVERVADRVAERLRHVRHRDVRGTAPSSGERQARPSQNLGVLGRLHERPRPGLHVEQDQIGVHRELLRHHARGDQRDDGTVAVASRSAYSFPSAGTRFADWAATAHPTIRTCRRDLVGRQVGPQPGDRLELVERPAGVTQSAARQLGDRHPERGRDRRERERHAVGHASGRVLVDRGAPQIAERHRVARVDHRPGERERLVVVESPQQARHEERRGERVGDVAGGVRPNERLDVARSVERVPVALARRRRRGDRRGSREPDPVREAPPVEALDVDAEEVGDRVS